MKGCFKMINELENKYNKIKEEIDNIWRLL